MANSTIQNTGYKTRKEGINITYGAGMSDCALSVMRYGDVITINGYVKATNAFSDSSQLVCTLPQGARPTDTLRFAGFIADQAYQVGAPAYCSITPTGEMYCIANAGSNKRALYLSCSFVAA